MDKPPIVYKMDKLDPSDPNNNSRVISAKPSIDSMNKSYSLRPRSSIRSHGEIDDDILINDWRPRGRTKRRPKQKPPPLSKYRRKTANARERSRMREINEAFDTLRRAIPHLTHDNSHSEKLTKITTLRLAMKYIAALNQVLQDPEPESDLDSGDYTLSLTPNSLSDHSDLYDQFLNSDLASTSSTTTNSCPFRSPSDHLSKFDLSSSSLLPTSPNCYSFADDVNSSASMMDLRQHCLTPTDDFEADLDSFVTSAVDFEELFAS
ncbi:helix-loop-helix protein delilah-like [Nilaparvata lugens]|uniref:helix-loop-helix protein delilah-like n=1 Tax=Nilaparvata lugens TaxID=108931 RepID=UPI00193CEC4C|nr:helix-loop-helix protein delilah-like [Nilaparvata lugens]